MFGSLDYIYIPAADVDGETQRYVQTLGAEVIWKVRSMGTTVACLRLGEPGPAILLSGHLPGRKRDLGVPGAGSRGHGRAAARTKRRCAGTGDTAGPVRDVHDGKGAAVRGVSARAARRGSLFRRPYRPIEASVPLLSDSALMWPDRAPASDRPSSRCTAKLLGVTVWWRRKSPLSLPLSGFAPRTERSSATCGRRSRPGHASNLREGLR